MNNSNIKNKQLINNIFRCKKCLSDTTCTPNTATENEFHEYVYDFEGDPTRLVGYWHKCA